MAFSGSQWRRWDVHVHTPETILNDQFGDWEEYLTTIEAQDAVSVIGVTDYLSIANYSKLKHFKDNGRISRIELLIPNIEFRIAPPTDRATAINIHLLISPEDQNHEHEIANALARLDWEYNRNRYSCVEAQLMALGRAFDSSIRDDRAALRMGVTQFKVDFNRFRTWYDAEHWLRRNSLVAVSAGEDGLSGFRRDGGWAAHRDEISRFSQVILSGRSGERDFWLGLGSDEDRKTVRRLGGPRPCVHGSDAHEIAKLFKPALDRFCWVKADPTFEGLKQTLYEPADRVYIGPSPPLFHDQARLITSVSLSNGNGWFDDVAIPLNSGLVSIIGQKGSGKSALAELIAFAAGSWHDDGGSRSFLSRAAGYLDELSVELEWADQTATELKVRDGQGDEAEIRYLSQKFVEHLCSEDNDGKELVGEIESVIFANMDATDTLNASTFQELKAIRTERVTEEGNRIRQLVADLIREEDAVREQVQKVPDKKTRIRTLTEEAKGLAAQIPKAVSAEEVKLQVELKQRYEALSAAQQEVGAFKQKLQKIADTRSRLLGFGTQMQQFHSEVVKALSEVGVPPSEHGGFVASFAGNIEEPLMRREAELRAAINGKEGTAEGPAEGTIRWLQQEIKTLSEKESADKAQQAKLKAVQARLAAIGAEIKRIEDEIKQAEGPLKARMEATRQERITAYGKYFENLKNEQTILEELYASVRTSLNTESESGQDLEFSIRWDAEIQRWLERGSALFDQRRTIPYGTMEGLASAAKRILLTAWTSGDPAKIATAHDQFLSEFRKGEPHPRNYLRSGVGIRDVLHWLYEVEHIQLRYGLKYNGVELEKLSPGTKGIVLLILYLGMDVADSRPLVVDQPDENLDNESIFKLLTSYFRKAKKRRQIILITHNPNLVVNADSEQIIIATCVRRANGLPHITYKCGALENVSVAGDCIRQQVCRILEGGTDAFLKRERRYTLDEDEQH